MKSATRPRRLLLRLRLAAVGLMVLLVAVVAAAPRIASSRMARPVLVAQANALLSPTQVAVESVKLSWTKPIQMTGLELRGEDGKTLVTAPRATLDRSLWQLLTDRPDYGTLTLDGATVDIERRQDGSIDLLDALDPILASDPDEPGDPRTALTLRVVGGSLRLVSPELAAPVVAEQLDLTLSAPAAPEPLNWQIHLATPSIGDEAALTLQGRYDHRAEGEGMPDLELVVEASRWPLSVALADVHGAGRLDGRVGLRCEAGRWATKGSAHLLDLDAAGTALRGDRLQLDQVAARWDVVDEDGGWMVRLLDVSSPVATINAEGTLLSASEITNAKLEGQIDLAALAAQIPNALRLRDDLILERGVVHLTGAVQPNDGGQTLEVVARMEDLAARVGETAMTWDDPATFEARLTRSGSGEIAVETVAARLGFLDATANGDLVRGVDLQATADLDALGDRLGQWLDLGGLEPSGQVRLAGRYAAPEGTYSAQLAVEVRNLVLAGLTDEPIQRSEARLDATANGPATTSGLPDGWVDGSLKATGEDLAFGLIAKQAGDVTDIEANLATAVRVPGRDARAEARIIGRRTTDAIELDEAHLALRSVEAGVSGVDLEFAAQGRYIADTGLVELQPLADRPSGPLTLAGGGLRITGIRPGSEAQAMTVEASLAGDLYALDRAIAYWTGGTQQGLAGALSASLSAQREPSGEVAYALRVESPDLARASGGQWRREGALTAQSRGVYRLDADRLDLDELIVQSRYGVLTAAGALAEPTGRRLADLRGTLSPDWVLVNTLLAATLEPNARLRGKVRPFYVRGPLSGANTAARLRGLDAELGIDVSDAVAFGVQVGAVPLVVRCSGGQVTIDPIATTVNGGQAELAPQVVLDEAGGITLVVAPGASVREAEINSEVSERVLSYIAPVLHQATQVRGRLSAEFDRVEVPLVGPAERSTVVVGRLTFHDVAYGPGPFVQQLVSLTGTQQAPALRLDQTIPFQVANGRVGQQGLSVAVSPDVQIALDGSVGFDGTLALRAGVPVTGAMLGGDTGALGQIVGGTRVGVPIGGTFARPQIDRGALQVGLRDVSRSMLQRGAAFGASELLDLIGAAPEASAEGEAPQQPGRDLERLPQEALRRLLTPPPRGESVPR